MTGDGVTSCSVCTATVQDNGHLCWNCTSQLVDCLETVESLREELENTAARLTVFGGDRPGHRKLVHAPLIIDPRASDHHRLLISTLLRWKTKAQSETGVNGPRDFDWLPEYLVRNVKHLRMQSWAGEAYGQITEVISKGWVIVDLPEARTLLGPCSACPTWIYGQEGAETVTCDSCGATENVRALLMARTYESDELMLSASQLSAALSTKAETLTLSRIGNWKARGKIEVRGYGDKGEPLYRTGDARALLYKKKRSAA